MPRLLTPPSPDVLPGTLADWRRALAQHYTRLGMTSRQRRFMSVLPNSSLKTIADHATPDIVLGIEAGGRVVGVLEIFKGKNAHAEIGISVEDAYQGRGFGKALFLHGLATAEGLGVRTADLHFSGENLGIRSLVTSAGGQILQRGAECEAHIEIAHCKDCHGDGNTADNTAKIHLLH